MALSEQDLQVAARMLEEAYDNRVAIAPLTTHFPDLDEHDAYAIQQFQVSAWNGHGRMVCGHKVGVTAAPTQVGWHVQEPDFGHLTRDMFLRADAPIELAEFVQPRVEPELAIAIREDLSGPGVTLAQAAAAIEAIRPALEIIDSRFQRTGLTWVDMVADNAESGGIVLGAEHPFDVDSLADVTCEISRNGEVIKTGVGSYVMGSPLRSLVWLANRLSRFDVSLLAGNVVMTGSLTDAIEMSSGDVITARVGDAPELSAKFV